MISTNTEEPFRVQGKWGKYFNTQLENNIWENSFNIIYKCTQNNELHEFHFKLLHQILANNEALYRWNLVQSDLCPHCHEEVESIYHIFLECEVVKHLWKDLENYILAKSMTRITLTNQEIVFGIEIRNFELLNLIYLVAKKTIYECRCRDIFQQ